MVTLFDGGTGEELFKTWHVPDDRTIWSAIAVKDERYHEALKQVHMSYVKSGSDYVTCNNFGITPGVGFSEDSIKELNQTAGRIARDAVSSSSAKVLASLPPLVESYRPDKVMAHEDGVRIYKECILDVMDAHVDGWLAETLSSSDEVIMALDAVHRYHTTKPVFVSMCVKRGGVLRSGERASEACQRIVAKANEWNIRLDGILFNCSRPEDISMALQDVRENAPSVVPLGAYPNRLTEISDSWELASNPEPQAMRDDLDEEGFVRICMEWVERYNVSILGGCCGIGPEYIARLRDHLLDVK